MTRLTKAQQIERFGMSLADATKLRDAVAAAMTPAETAAARQAWQDLAYELRGGKGQPFQTSVHPERLRMEMLQQIHGGATLADACNAVRKLAADHPL